MQRPRYRTIMGKIILIFPLFGLGYPDTRLDPLVPPDYHDQNDDMMLIITTFLLHFRTFFCLIYTTEQLFLKIRFTSIFK